MSNHMTDDEARKFYGEDAREWLRRWDAGETVWTIEMGGLGPGYEQCIHVTCAEALRFMLAENMDSSKWDDGAWRDTDSARVDSHLWSNPAVEALGGITGAQAGAAKNLACMLYRHGPVGVMRDERVKDRHIQVCRRFP